MGPAQRTRGVTMIEPRLQACLMEEVATGEPVHHRLRLEPGKADPAVRGAGPATRHRRGETDRAGPAAEPVGEAGLRWPLRRRPRRRRRGGAKAEHVEGGAEELLHDRHGEGSVDEHEGENALRWGRQARKPHGCRIAGTHGRSKGPLV